jgi:hypothetical protein
MIGESRQFVTDEPVEFENQPDEVQDFRRITDHFRGMYRVYPQFSARKLEDVILQTLGSQQLVMPYNHLPDH